MNRFLTTLVLLCTVFLSCLADADKFILVIDPGHGGGDNGARGAKYKEKDIVLSVALKLGKLVNDGMDDVEVVYTRKTDKFITLEQRSNIANKSHGDLFISIHVNSMADRKARKTIKGAETYTLSLKAADVNLDVAKQENAVVMYEENYEEKYSLGAHSREEEIMQELEQREALDRGVNFAAMVQKRLVNDADRADRGVRQANFHVLRMVYIPAVLVELDFICNPSIEKYLGSGKGQKEMAQALYDAFKDYRNSPQGRPSGGATAAQNVPSPTSDDNGSGKPENDNKDQNNDKTLYRIQILAGNTKLPDNSPEFKGLKGVERHWSGKIYKYTYGSTTSLKQARKLLKEARKKFKDAFIVTDKDGKLTRYYDNK